MPEDTENPPQQAPPDAAPETAPEDAAAAADEQPSDGLPLNEVAVEDAGTLKKKVTVTVPRERIDAKFEELFGELGRSAQVPGFRIGRAPRRLIERRFGKEVAEDVRNGVIGEALGDALKQADLKALGEPDIKLDEIELPEAGALVFDFEVEVPPEFDLPDYKGIEVKRPVMEITTERIDRAIDGYRERYGTLKPVDAPAADGDVVIADVDLRGDGVAFAQANVELRVAPAQIEGVLLEDLPKALSGKTSGQRVEMKATVPAGHPNEAWRGKDVTVRLDLKDVKRMDLPAFDDAFAGQMGFASAEEARQEIRRRFEARLESEQKRYMRSQVGRFFLARLTLDLPEGMTERHTTRLLQRRVVDLMMRGVPRDQVEQDLEQLQAEASKEALDELKLTFILAKVAEAESIEVEDAEINARIASMAREHNRRPERLRQEMESEGTLETLTVALREEKAIDHVLATANIVDVEPARDAGDEAEDGKDKPAKRGTRKKKTKAGSSGGKS